MRRQVISILFLFLILAPIPVMAQSISLGLGIQKPGDDKYWISGTYRMQLKEHFSLNPEIGYSRRSISDDACFGSRGCVQRSALDSDLNLGVHALFTIPKDRFSFSFGGGMGAHFLRREFSITHDFPTPTLQNEEDSRSDVQPGLHFLGEFDIAVSDRLSIFLANRSEFVRKFNDNFKLYGGVRWKF